MYDLINAHIDTILKQKIIPSHVNDYSCLIQNLSQITGSQFQKKYRGFWVMRFPCQAYCQIYFQTLQAAMTNPPTLNVLAENLYNTPSRKDGSLTLEFSFATKLLHMINPQTPIYDSKVAAFYFFQEPNSKRPLQERIARFCAFHAFLIQEYQRVLQNGLLASSIRTFRQKFSLQNFTDEKVIDSLIWAYVVLLQDGALTKGQVIYR